MSQSIRASFYALIVLIQLCSCGKSKVKTTPPSDKDISFYPSGSVSTGAPSNGAPPSNGSTFSNPGEVVCELPPYIPRDCSASDPRVSCLQSALNLTVNPQRVKAANGSVLIGWHQATDRDAFLSAALSCGLQAPSPTNVKMDDVIAVGGKLSSDYVFFHTPQVCSYQDIALYKNAGFNSPLIEYDLMELAARGSCSQPFLQFKVNTPIADNLKHGVGDGLGSASALAVCTP